MQDGPNAKQQIVERVKSSTNILVTVSSNPSVDELAAALALTLMLNKLDKHATAVFSGNIPPAINFLDPTKTFENTVDSLRDFIIALDKEKADRLRYKVENDVVRIFITPYKTTITEKDLQFSQGDFNVETIVALGVEKREELDKAIVAHGRILHDAVVITINNRHDTSSLGSIDWQEPAASSLCEMLMNLVEPLGPAGLLDEQISTALLTGMVAATDRFSNQKTSPRVMTMAAQLMAAGANQQLIAINLQQAVKENGQAQAQTDGSIPLKPGDASAKVEKAKKKPADGEMQIDHKKPVDEAPEPGADAAAAAEAALSELTKPKADTSLSGLKTAIAEETAAAQSESASLPPVQEEKPAPKPESGEESSAQSSPSWKGRRIEPPTLGGILNATTEEAHEDSIRAEQDKRNSKILSHDNPIKRPPTFKDLSVAEPVSEVVPSMPAEEPQVTVVDPDGPLPSATPTPPAAAPTLEELERQAHEAAAQVPPQDASLPPTPPPPIDEPVSPSGDVDAARQAVHAALASEPFDPAHNPLQATGAQPLEQVGDQSQVATMPPVFESSNQPSSLPPLTYEPAAVPASTQQTLPPPQPFDLPPPPPMPPLPDFNNLPPVPPALPEPPMQPGQPLTPPNLNAQTPPPATPTNPSQFKIPG